VSGQKQSLIITASKAEVRAFAEFIITQPDSACQTTERQNLTGDVPTWLAVASLGVSAIGPVLEFLIELLKLNRVKRIKWDDLEIENPSARDVEQLRKRLDAQRGT
jgi:hypothetical protein